MTITFVPKKLATAQVALQTTSRAQCDRVLLYPCSAVLSDVKDKFHDSETIQILTRYDSSVTGGLI